MQTQPEAAPLVQLSIPTPAGDAQSDAAIAVKRASLVTIFDAGDSLLAQEFRAQVNTRIKVLTDARLALTRPIDAAKKTIMDFFNGPITLLETARRTLDGKVLAFDTEQENIRREAQRKVEAEAAKERARLQAIADAAAAKGQESKAEKFQERAAQVVAPIIQANTAKASGSSFRDNWKWRLKDKSKINAPFLMTVTNDDAIDAIVKSQKGNAEAIAAIVGTGIEIYNERIVASRRA